MLRKFFNRVLRSFRMTSNRRVFEFYDGVRWRSVDPIEVWYQIENHPKYLPSEHRRLVREGDQEAVKITADAACDIFKVTPYTDEADRKLGMTIGERVALVNTFFDYCDWVKKNIEPGATTAHSTA